LAASFDVPMLNPKFTDQPHNFLYIERTAPSPNYQHPTNSLLSFCASNATEPLADLLPRQERFFDAVHGGCHAEP
jgi:hypothetical protein